MEVWFKVTRWGVVQIEEVKVEKVTEKSVTYISNYWKKPQRSMHRHEFFPTEKQAVDKIIENQKAKVAILTRSLAILTRSLAEETRRLDSYLTDGLKIERLVEAKCP
jgi:hypothetical protein